MWRSGRDSNPRDGFPLHTFQACAFDHSATAPWPALSHGAGKGARVSRTASAREGRGPGRPCGRHDCKARRRSATGSRSRCSRRVAWPAAPAPRCGALILARMRGAMAAQSAAEGARSEGRSARKRRSRPGSTPAAAPPWQNSTAGDRPGHSGGDRSVAQGPDDVMGLIEPDRGDRQAGPRRQIADRKAPIFSLDLKCT